MYLDSNSGDQRKLNGTLFQILVQLINQMYSSSHTFLQNLNPHQQQNNAWWIKLTQAFQLIQKLNQKYSVNFFWSFLVQIQIEPDGKQLSLLSKFCRVVLIFLKTALNCTENGEKVWAILKHFTGYVQNQKGQLMKFRGQLTELGRCKTLLANKIGYQIQKTFEQVREEYRQFSSFKADVWTFIYELNCDTKFLGDINHLKRCINKVLSKIPRSFCEQIHINKLKKIYQSQLTKINNAKKLCCSIFLNKQQKFEFQAHQFNDYEDIKIPLNPEGQKYIKKMFVSFLNTNGGIHFIGVKISPNNKIVVQGCLISQTQKIDFLRKIYQLVHSIYPDEQLQPKKQPNLLLNTYLFELNKFASVQLIPLVNSQNGQIDLFEVSLDRKSYRRYLVKIKVKCAPKYDTYMLKDVNPCIQSYCRKKGIIEKVLPSQFPQFFNQRCQEYLFGNTKVGNPDCPNCRHNYLIENDAVAV